VIGLQNRITYEKRRPQDGPPLYLRQFWLSF
jgi:hypothetical protein